nr:protein SELF-PRUNING-like [Physcomitrium patens]|eukprot:XP_024386096.1 protein SELF-PRUNING-like [Physcomitrella patens]
MKWIPLPTPDLVKGVVGHLEQTGIIPEVIDRFTPTTTVRLIYNDNLEVLDGTKVSENDVSKQPKVEIEGAFVMPGSLYTIMLVSSSAIGEGKERVHWIHVNYQGPQDIGSAVIRAGADVLHCEAPKAGSNSNQLVFLLFRQPGQLVVPTAHSNDEISARSFAATHHLTPVGALCFMVA